MDSVKNCILLTLIAVLLSFIYLFILSIEHELNVDKSSGSTTRFAKTLTVAGLKHKTIN